VRLIPHIAAGLFFFSVFSCSHTDTYRQFGKTADSLVGAVIAVTGELQQPDTASLNHSLQIYERYGGFISSHVNDTVARETAELLKRFYESGINLQSYRLNRTDLLARAALNISQLEKLSADANNKSVKIDILREFLATEKSAAVEIIHASQQQLQLLNRSLGQLNNCMTGIENLIKSYNNGELPVVVKENSIL
jgi:hypothetical protein